MSNDALVGKIIGHYQVLERLGEGGMGRVYRGHHTQLGRDVALKIMSPEMTHQPGYLERFEREAKVSAKLDHPSIVTIYDSGKHGNLTYIAMKLLTGGGLEARLRQRMTGLPSLGEVAQMLLDLGSALDYAHQFDVIHRDIKPANIMFDSHGKAYLVDFGIAKMLSSQDGGLTGAGMTMGSPAYMPPEQWKGEGVTAKSDQYALAVTIYHTLTGKLPFEAKNTPALMYKHLQDEPKPITEIRPNFPVPVMMVLGKAMSKDPERRWESCSAFAQAFAQAVPDNQKEATGFFTTPLSTPDSEGFVEDSWTVMLSMPDHESASMPVIGRAAVVEDAAPSRRGVSKSVMVGGLLGVVVIAGIGVVAMLSGTSAPITLSPTGETSPQAPIVILATETQAPTVTDSPTETALPTVTPPPTETPIPSPAVGMSVRAQKDLMLRKDTSPFIIAQGAMVAGETAEIIEMAEESGVSWVRVRTSDGEEGWEKASEFELIP